VEHYIDHNATSPMTKETIRSVRGVQAWYFGNPSSVHSVGADARAVLDGARESIASLIGCHETELYFTSGGTEANNWAIFGIMRQNPLWPVVVSAIEHKSILRPAMERFTDRCGIVPAEKTGKLALEQLAYILVAHRKAPGALVSVMLANNETGVIQPIREVVEMVRKYKPEALVHVDACQALGKIPVNVNDLGVDLMTISAHKIGGPKGIGALFIRRGIEISPLILGGHQEGDLRAGTENVAAVIGFDIVACERISNLAGYARITSRRVEALTALLFGGLSSIWINGEQSERIPNTINIGFNGLGSDALVMMLSAGGIIVSNGSACESGSLEGSHVLKAMGQPVNESNGAIRFSFSDDAVKGDRKDAWIADVADNIIASVDSLRNMQRDPDAKKTRPGNVL